MNVDALGTTEKGASASVATGPHQVPDALAEQLTSQPTYGNNCPLLRVCRTLPSS